MIPLPFPRIYLYAGIAAACVAVFLYVRFLQARVDYWKDRNEQTQAILTTERAQYKQAEAAMEERRTRDMAEASQLREQTNAHLLDRVRFHTDAADALRVRLAAERRLSPLKAASSAPADCGNYEADRSKLPQQDVRFLVDEATSADALGELIEACRADYKAVKVACGVKD